LITLKNRVISNCNWLPISEQVIIILDYNYNYNWKSLIRAHTSHEDKTHLIRDLRYELAVKCQNTLVIIIVINYNFWSNLYNTVALTTYEVRDTHSCIPARLDQEPRTSIISVIYGGDEWYPSLFGLGIPYPHFLGHVKNLLSAEAICGD